MQQDINEYLKALPANCDRDTWIRIGGAFKSAGGDFETFDRWSQTAPERYDAPNCRSTWNSLTPSANPGGAAGLLRKLAKEAGAVFPDEPMPRRIAPPPPQKQPEGPNQPPAGGGAAPEGKKVVAVYQYRDRDGRLKALQLRYDPKDFRPRYAVIDNPCPLLYDDQRHWTAKKPDGFEMPLYHEDQIASRPGETVYLLEGEKDADNLAKLGYLTSCHKAGGGAVKSGRGMLSDRECIIIQDADEPGRKYAKAAAEALGSQCVAVFITEPPAGFKDYSEWEEAQDSAETMEDLKARFETWGTTKSTCEMNDPPAAPVKMTLLEIREKIRQEGKADPNEIIKSRFLCKGGAGLLSAETGIGKSSFIMQIATHWADGKPCFDMEPVRPLKILIIQAENDLYDIGEEDAGICRGTGYFEQWTYEQTQKSGGAVTVIFDVFHSGDDFICYLGKELQQYAETKAMPDLVIIDPLLAFAGCDLSDQGKVTHFLRNGINPLLKRYNIAALFVHHMTKPTKTAMPNTNYNKAYSYHGSGDIINWARCSLVLERFKDKDGRFFCVLTAEKRGRRLGWENDKKYLRWSDDYIYWEELKTPPEMEQPATFTAEDRAAQREQHKRDRLFEEAQQAADLLKPGESMTAADFRRAITGRLGITSTNKRERLIDVCIAQGFVTERQPTKEEKTSPGVRKMIERPAEPPEQQAFF